MDPSRKYGNDSVWSFVEQADARPKNVRPLQNPPTRGCGFVEAIPSRVSRDGMGSFQFMPGCTANREIGVPGSQSQVLTLTLKYNLIIAVAGAFVVAVVVVVAAAAEVGRHSRELAHQVGPRERKARGHQVAEAGSD
jgi:hypothetical protein